MINSNWQRLALFGLMTWAGLTTLGAAPSKERPLSAREKAEIIADAQLLERANEFYRAGRFNLAIPLYRKLEEKQFMVGAVSFNLGNSYFQLGDLPKAAAAYRKTMRLGSEATSSAQLNLAAVLFRMGQNGEAVAAYHRVLREQPEMGDAWLYLAECYKRTGDLVGAQRAYENSLKVGAADASAIYQWAETFVEQKDYGRAVEVARMGLARFPSENDLWFYIGDLERLRNQSDAALAAYRQGLLAQPNNSDVLYKMADVAANSNRIPMAMDYLDQAIRVKPDFTDAMVFLGNLAYDLKWSDRAYQAYLNAAKRGNTEGAQGILNLAFDAAELGLKNQALTWLSPMAQIKIDNPLIQSDLNQLRTKLTQTESPIP
jgi:tetratricopeptide (TPR) repeat protein